MTGAADEDAFDPLLRLRGEGMSSRAPELAEWLALEDARLAELVRARALSIALPGDGTRRYALLRSAGETLTPQRYLALAEQGLSNMLGRVFACGVHTVLCPLLPPSAFARGEAYALRGLQASVASLTGAALRDHYAAWGVRARLYGHRDVPASPAVREALHRLEDALIACTPAGERLLLFGFSPLPDLDASLAAAARLGPDSARAAVRRALFPEGPTRVDLAVTYGQLRVNAILPALLDEGADVYHLPGLPFDLAARDLRLMLYDHLFTRPSARRDVDAYDGQSLDLIRWASARADSVEGLDAGTLRQLREPDG
ncbi:MAG: hypothetical protein K1X39_14850 [Thermoflexales bacterium]|nr:hypothetical protein [Thermoflexales bacterium]